MIASVHVADLGASGVARALRRRPDPAAVLGLRWAQVPLFAPLALSRPPRPTRAGVIGFWDDEEAIDRFMDADPVGRRFSEGFHARLKPLRAFGSWPGLPRDLPSTTRCPTRARSWSSHSAGSASPRRSGFCGRAGRPRRRRRTTRAWPGAARRYDRRSSPPCPSGRAPKTAAAFTYGQQQPAHPNAIAAQQRKDFHRRSAFIRFEPVRLEGALDGPNPLSASAIVT